MHFLIGIDLTGGVYYTSLNQLPFPFLLFIPIPVHFYVFHLPSIKGGPSPGPFRIVSKDERQKTMAWPINVMPVLLFAIILVCRANTGQGNTTCTVVFNLVMR